LKFLEKFAHIIYQHFCEQRNNQLLGKGEKKKNGSQNDDVIEIEKPE